MNTLEALWYGNICPNEHPIEHGSEYARALYQLGDEVERLLLDFSPEQQKSIETLLDLQMNASVIGERDAFVMGFRLAVQLLLDCLTSPPGAQHSG